MVTESSGAFDGYRFQLIGGALGLDFTNTLGRGVTETREHLEDYADLVRWSRQAEVLNDVGADRLLARARESAAEARAALVRARELRETLYRIFAAEARGTACEPADLETLNDALQDAMAHSRLVPDGEALAWGWEEGEALDRMLWPVLRSAADLLTSGDRPQVKECDSDTCEWLFLDTTKNGRRRWCDMRSCGNQAKVRRHRQRRKAKRLRKPS